MNEKLKKAMERIAESTRNHTGRCDPADVYELAVVIQGILSHLGIEDEEPTNDDTEVEDVSSSSDSSE